MLGQGKKVDICNLGTVMDFVQQTKSVTIGDGLHTLPIEANNFALPHPESMPPKLANVAMTQCFRVPAMERKESCNAVHGKVQGRVDLSNASDHAKSQCLLRGDEGPLHVKQPIQICAEQIV